MDSSPEGLIKLRDAARMTQKIDPSEVQNPLTRKALDKWNDLRGDRRFPSRKDAAPRELSSLLRNIALIRVMHGGADFEFRVLGDAIIQSQTGLQIGMTTNELDEAYPGYGALFRTLYQEICDTRAPQAYRGFYERAADRRSFYHESLLLPLGADDGVVDHILVVGVYAMDADKPLV
ncbi:MAG TPA: PAS domain-containing protein [Rhizomicrobium sp.]|nr:PAS domain-containing protein [Rhizomicrobium sp.]